MTMNPKPRNQKPNIRYRELIDTILTPVTVCKLNTFKRCCLECKLLYWYVYCWTICKRCRVPMLFYCKTVSLLFNGLCQNIACTVLLLIATLGTATFCSIGCRDNKLCFMLNQILALATNGISCCYSTYS